MDSEKRYNETGRSLHSGFSGIDAFCKVRGWHLNLTKVFEEFHCRFFSKVHLNTEKTYLVSAFSEQCVCEMSGTTSAYVKK